MREIKFRVWSKQLNRFLSADEPINRISIIKDHEYSYHRLYTFINYKDDLEIQQFTELKDKIGNEIYEGDIVKMKDVEDNIERIGFVDFSDGSFRINCGFITCYRWMYYEVEVIGNIYENKELLNDE